MVQVKPCLLTGKRERALNPRHAAMHVAICRTGLGKADYRGGEFNFMKCRICKQEKPKQEFADCFTGPICKACAKAWDEGTDEAEAVPDAVSFIIAPIIGEIVSEALSAPEAPEPPTPSYDPSPEVSSDSPDSFDF